MAAFTEGQRVRFTADSLGVIDPDSPRPAFLPWKVGKAQVGTYAGPHPHLKDWHEVTVTREGRDFTVPVHLSMVEAVS